MIEKMKMVYVVSSLSQKKEMLDGLKKLGILHIAEKKHADRATSERFTDVSKTASMLLEYAPDKKAAKKMSKPTPISREEFYKLYDDVKDTFERKAALIQELTIAQAEIDRITPWGEFSPSDLEFLRENGYDLHFYRLTKEEYKMAVEDEDVKLIHLKNVNKMIAVAVLGPLPPHIHGSETTLPERGADDLNQAIAEINEGLAECDEFLRNAALHMDSFNEELLRAQNAKSYSVASETADSDDEFVWLSGYIPEEDLDNFRALAKEKSWAYAVEDVDADDDQIPTKLKYGKVSGLIKPVFDILGILPGYRETDISLWFLLFFTLFFAMIIGDAAYGILILLGTIGYVVKTKKNNTATYLLFVLSIATIIWGAITGTWFGMESAMKVPFLKAMVIPSFANYPEYFGVTAEAQQNMIMKFSFSIGAIQMALGSLLAIKKKIKEKNLSWVADLGWLIAVIAMYLLSLYLVIGENIPVKPVFILIGIAFVTVVLFGGMSPDKTFGQGLKSGLADSFTVFLNTISCFGNVMSYIRLFAVGMAGLAISQSFNNIAASFGGPMVIVAILVVLIGHGLNIIMCFLSVVVHGVRLNVLEFSGQVGLEWAGLAYEPFKEEEKINK